MVAEDFDLIEVFEEELSVGCCTRLFDSMSNRLERIRNRLKNRLCRRKTYRKRQRYRNLSLNLIFESEDDTMSMDVSTDIPGKDERRVYIYDSDNKPSAEILVVKADVHAEFSDGDISEAGGGPFWW